jgi:hypothetical protein
MGLFVMAFITPVLGKRWEVDLVFIPHVILLILLKLTSALPSSISPVIWLDENIRVCFRPLCKGEWLQG